MIELARLRPGQGFSVGKFFGYYSLRLVPFIAIRRFIARILSRYLNRSRRKPADLPPIAEHLFQTVVERGVSMAPPVADLCIREMRAFLRDQVMVAGDGRGFTEENVPSDVRLASY